MKWFLFQFIIWGLAATVFADDLSFFSITTNQATEIKQQLNLFEKGELTLKTLNENAGAEGCRRLVGYYLTYSNDISPKAKLPVARAAAMYSLWSDAITLAADYSKAYPSDWRGWRLLGAAYDSINSPSQSIAAYRNAVKFGDTNSYEALAGEALQSDHLDIVKEIIPELMSLKNSKHTSIENKQHLITILLVYAMKTDQRDLFIQALQGEDFKSLIQNAGVKKDITSGCDYFADEDADGKIDKIRQELGTATNSTNSISPPSR